MAAVIIFICFLLILALLNLIVFFFKKREFKKPNRKWANIDNDLPIVDEKRKKIDRDYYQEKDFLVVRGDRWNGMRYPYRTIEMTLNNKSILRWVCRLLLSKGWTVTAYTSDHVVGKLIFDRAHAKRHFYLS